MEEGKRTRNNKVGKRKKHTKSARKKEKKGQIQCEEEDALSISNLTYSEPGSPFPDCREGLTDRLSNSVLLPGIEPRTGQIQC